MLYLIKFNPIYHIGDVQQIWRLAFPKIIGWYYRSSSDTDPIVEWYTFPIEKVILME